MDGLYLSSPASANAKQVLVILRCVKGRCCISYVAGWRRVLHKAYMRSSAAAFPVDLILLAHVHYKYKRLVHRFIQKQV